MALQILSDWITTLSLIFGGCCSNAITLEQLTSQYSQAGSLITLFQFLLISLHGLPKHLTWSRYGPRFKPRRIPLTPYLTQVTLFYLVSLLNNAAFAYRIPMAVHIIFRSGGLIISMILGRIVAGKRYSITQVISVLLVTLGVVLTTLSASQSKSKASLDPTTDAYTYATGIAILTLALLFSGFLGLVQDWTYSHYGRPSLSPSPQASSAKANHTNTPNSNPAPKPSESPPPGWQESMFYLHFLALPMFFFVRHDLAAQLTAINSGPRISLPLPSPLPPALTPFLASFYNTTLSKSSFINNFSTSPNETITIPHAYLPLLLNTLTQLLCVAGVHRLTTRVSALTVTLVLVVRKAVSLVISVVGVDIIQAGGPGHKGGQVDARMMWTGAGLVLLGTVGYSLGTAGHGKSGGKQTKAKKE